MFSIKHNLDKNAQQTNVAYPLNGVTTVSRLDEGRVLLDRYGRYARGRGCPRVMLNDRQSFIRTGAKRESTQK